MKKFIVTVQKSVDTEVVVEAENRQEANNKACDMVDTEDYEWGDTELNVLYTEEIEDEE